MLTLRHFLKGDTLIEVTIAIGIFTLVAISVVAVVNISTSGAQSALENTLTRESVDSQAETIRFIQGAFDTDRDLGDLTDISKINLYKALWGELKHLAEQNINFSGGIDDSLVTFQPTECNDLYEDNKSMLMSQNAFIIDSRKLATYKEGDDLSQFIKQVVLPASSNPAIFVPATTYPQLTYASPDGSLIGDNLRGSTLASAEGIYVVGIKDTSKTNIVDKEGVKTESAYYDFYVRSCWYNAGSETPTTVSTAIRLRDPEAIAYIEPAPIVPDKPEEPEEITFDNVEWVKYGDRQYSSCGSEPAAGQHVTFPDSTSIKLLGSTKNAVTLGAYYDKFSIKEAFSLQVDVNASNIGAHPSENGSFTIKFDIVNESGATVVKGVEASIKPDTQIISIPDTQEKITMSTKTFNLLLEYNRGKFKACTTEPGKTQQCITATKQIPADSYLKVDFGLMHGSHCCSSNAHVELSDIQMRRSSTGTITF